MLTTPAMAASSSAAPDYSFQRVRGAAIGSATSVADNPENGFRASVGPDGIQVAHPDDDWNLGLTVRAIGCANDLVPVEPAGLELDGPRAELHRGAVVEWYVNDHRGLEQGFTVLEPPASGDHGTLFVEMAVATELAPLLAATGQRVDFIPLGSRFPVLSYGSLAVIDAEGRALPARMELAHAGEDSATILRLVVDAHGAAYPVTIDPLVTSSVWSSTETDNTISVAWGDVDGDGDLDLAAGNWTGPNRVYQNTGGTLSTAAVWSSSESDNTESVSWGDVDGDGDLDLAAGNYGQPNRVYQNTGGTLSTAAVWSSSESDNTESVAWGDWDGDSDLDLAVGNYAQANRLYRNDAGTLTSAAVWSSTETDNTTIVALGDWNGDSDLDLAVGNDGINRVYDNTAGVPTLDWSSTETDSTTGLAWGDRDGDGDLDLAVGNYGQAARVYDNTGGTLSAAAVWSSTETDNTLDVAWGDWDGDGDLDLAASNDGQANTVYENTAGVLAPIWASTETDGTVAVAWGDWDGDGDLDLVAGNNGVNRVYENTGGQLALEWSSTEKDQNEIVAWADWDGDGDLDLASGNWTNNRVYENTGGALSSSAVWSSTESERTYTMEWGDWDGDGDLDLATGGDGPPVRVHENTGGNLTAAWASADSLYVHGVTWGDWDNDGDLDLAVAYYGFPNRVYENTGGTLTTTPVWSSTESEQSWSVAWGDWDNDGDLDLAVGNEAKVNRVYENTGGTLSSSGVWASDEADNTLMVAWGDWNGDGDLDLAAGNRLGVSRVYENTGGTLATTAVWSSTEAGVSHGIGWGDWDNDGDLDLAMSKRTGGSLVYENTGGDLVLGWTVPAPDDSLTVAWGDWDNDGDLDLADGSFSTSEPLRVYDNGAVQRPGRLPETAVSPVLADRPGVTDTAYFHSSEECLLPPVMVDYLLVDDENDPARSVVAEYSLVGGGQWLPATAQSGTTTEELAASSAGTPHQFGWDADTDAVPRPSDNVVFRITVPYQASTRLAGSVQRAAMSASSPPFRICPEAIDLAITKDDGQTEAVPGDSVTYTIVASNAGPNDAIGATVNDLFPAVLTCSWTCVASGGATCAAGPVAGNIADTVDLPVGGSATYTADCSIDGAASGTLENTASVAVPPGMIDSDPGNNSATDTDVLLELGPCGFFNSRSLSGTVADQQTFQACISITASDFSVVPPSGDVTLRAGVSVILGNGFVVEPGRLLTIDIDPALAP
jgi:uncharacterized repeat protein (TIGR01451 family)